MSPERRPYQFQLEEVARLARESTLKYGSHPPALIVEGSKKATGIGPLLDLPGTFEARQELMHMVGQVLAASAQFGELRQVIFISEGWMSVLSKEPKVQMRPSVDPARKEVLVIDCLSIEDHKNNLILFEMIRDDIGTLLELRDMDSPNDKGNLSAQSPLLTAFLDGYNAAS